jgi:hypothetical protein
MIMKRLLFSLLILFALLAPAPAVKAQCAMCQATVESNSKQGGDFASGVNTGILYLMSIPYLLGGGIGIIWYRNNKKKKKELADRIATSRRRTGLA